MKKDNLPVWDLGRLYLSTQDPRIEKDIKKALAMAQQFEMKYRKSIKSKLTATELLNALKQYEKIFDQATRILTYGRLSYSADSQNPAHGALYQKTYAKYIEINNTLVFFELGLAGMGEKKLKSLMKDEALKNYRHFFEKILLWKPHRLTFLK